MTEDKKLDMLITLLDHAARWNDEELLKAVTNSIIEHNRSKQPQQPAHSFNPDDNTRTED